MHVNIVLWHMGALVVKFSMDDQVLYCCHLLSEIGNFESRKETLNSA